MFNPIISGYRIELDYDELGYILIIFNNQGDLLAACCDSDYNNALFKLELLILEWDILHH